MKQGTFVFDREMFAEIRKFCTPYLFFVICLWILGQIDRYMLQAYISTEDLNAYDLILKCLIGIEFVQNSLSAVISPKLYEIWNKNKVNETTPESNRYSNVFTAINIIQLILFCIFIPIVYTLIVKNETFYRGEAYIGILAAGYGLRSIVLFYLATILFSKKINLLLKIFGFSAGFQIILSLIAIKHFGLMGAIYAGLATKVLQVILCMVFTRSVFRYNYNYFKIIAIPFFYVLLNLVQFLVFTEYNILLYIGQLVAFGILLFLVFRNEIRKVLISFGLFPDPSS